jgi:pyruvate formate lyase activating enzyme
MKEELLYEKLSHKMVHCHLCPHDCVIPEGKTGYCGVRKNSDGTLYALTYGKVVSIAIDPIEKKPLNHFYPGASAFSIGTFGCNMRCKHCCNWTISHHTATEEGLDLHDLSPEEAVQMAKDRECEVLAWTYNEPSIWFEFVLDTAKLAKEAGLLTVMVTSGMISPPALKTLLNYIDAYRLDIKGFTEEFYERLTGSPVLKHILENALIAFRSGVHVEIITNIIPNWNDSDEQLNGLARWIVDNLDAETPWHVTRYHPENKLTEPSTPTETLERAKEIGHKNGLKYVYIGNVPGHPGQNTTCPECSKVLIDRAGFSIGENHILKGCCQFCGYKIGHYRGPDKPVKTHTTPFPEYIL